MNALISQLEKEMTEQKHPGLLTLASVKTTIPKNREGNAWTTSRMQIRSDKMEGFLGSH